MLIDEVKICVEGGRGGDGSASFAPGMKSGPDGGNGGKGGNVYIVGSDNLRALNQFSHKTHYKAQSGANGMRKKMYGLAGEDLEIPVPMGTTLRDEMTGETFEVVDKETRFLIARGGAGGRGNFEFRSSTNTTPKYAEKGFGGQVRNLHLILKFLAEYGLIGLPNAGKSSMLNVLTNAKARVGAYAFTTLEPNLGVINGRVIADIPGLIEGASSGKGLGIKFLKHIEKVKLLLHCISSESDDVIEDFKIINKELEEFDQSMIEKDRIILLTKTDLIDDKEIKQKIKKLSKLGCDVYGVSVDDEEGVNKIKQVLVEYSK